MAGAVPSAFVQKVQKAAPEPNYLPSAATSDTLYRKVGIPYTMTLPDAAYALDELAAGRTPDRARLLAGALALDSAAADRDLLDAAAELHLVAAGATVDLTKRGRARAAAWAAIVRRLNTQG